MGRNRRRRNSPRLYRPERYGQNEESMQPHSRRKPRSNNIPMPIRLLPILFFIVLCISQGILFWCYQNGNLNVSEISVSSLFKHDDPSTPILIVGGSDGSGTRAFVEILLELGTITVSEDPNTFDVHASEVSEGWPGLIKRIFLPFGRKGFFSMESSSNGTLLSVTDSHLVANYDWPPPKLYSDSGYESVYRKVEADVEKLITSWNRSYKLERKLVRTKGRASRSKGLSKKMYPDANARDVSYAVKAPVSMLALPVFTKCYSSLLKKQSQKPRTLKFLHVIRDGRDVALSDNQSPVIKFYNLTYPNHIQQHESLQSKFSASTLQQGSKDRMYVKAMQLWNDWNLVVHRWATNHNINNQSSNSRSDTDLSMVDYLWVRSEDLLIPGSQKRLDALTAIAQFVGSSLTHEQLCCLSRQDTKDHGKSHRANDGTDFKAPRSNRLSYRHPRKRLPQTKRRHRRLSAFDNGRYNRWKIAVNSALKTNNNMPMYWIQEGERLLTTLREQNKTDATDETELEILDLIQQLKNLSYVRKPKFIDGNKNQTGHHQVSKRYGKWQKALENKTDVLDRFLRDGAEGLRVFGYHPYREVSYIQVRAASENSESSSMMSGEIHSNKSIVDDAAVDAAVDADGETAPGICEVSIACPN